MAAESRSVNVHVQDPGFENLKTTQEDVVARLSAANSTTQPEAVAPSKNALKKEIKNKQREQEKAKKAAALQSCLARKSLPEDDQEIDPTYLFLFRSVDHMFKRVPSFLSRQYFDNRIKALEALTKAGISPYPPNPQAVMPLPEYVEKYSYLNSGQRLENVTVSVAWRVMNKRPSSSKLFFYDLHDDGAKVQVMADARISELSEDEFAKFHGGVKRGDIVQVVGYPGISKRGELSLFPKSLTVLSHCLHMLPRQKPATSFDTESVKKNDAWVPGRGRNPDTYVLKDQETRCRLRCLDLMVNMEVRHIFQTRAKVISYVRRFLENLNFLEVETPMMPMIAGGAAARPFETYHHDLHMRLFMRIARIDLTHNPKFTTCECYIAHEDYTYLMDMNKCYKIGYHANGFENEAIEIDFTPPFRRVDMIEDLEKMAGLNIPKDLASDEANKYLAEACAKFDIKCAPPLTTARLLDKLVGHSLEETCVNPAFIIDHPEIMSPLAKSHRSKPGKTERFELFINKRELCNAYTELNDPVAQRRRFADQLKDRQSGDDEAMALDETFCTALEYALPPTAGWGMGIDRLAMLLTDSQNIKDVILFPAMRPQDEPAVKSMVSS
ncbi:hypothetical protein DCAR_0207119 [Daucus carota subsp. sativus]|uniref:lysine--tRNA ligase n=1 Tax=Daucus carota subsp. sativus TaxID=79200 RepID=A0AAF1APA8_DAUCS|nr:hypothetical protein DCAR_0207119 [Daucus carota subsp. sativus]